MADNTAITPGTGETIRDKDRAGVKTQIVGLDLGIGTGTESLMAGSLPITILGTGGLTQVSGSITAAVGNTLGSAVTASTTAQVVAAVPLAGNATFALAASAFVGTVTFEVSVDAGLNYAPIMAIREDGTGAESSIALNIAAASVRQYTVALAGMAYFRVRCSAFTSGTLAVLIAPGPTLMEPNPSLAASTAAIGHVGRFMPTTVGSASGNQFQGRIVATALTAGAVITGVPTPGAGLSLYVTDFAVSNSGTAATVVSLLPAAGTAFWDSVAAPAGGGSSEHFITPLKVTAATALNYAMTVASTSVYINVAGFIAQ